MARAKATVTQRGFNYGEVRPDFLEGDDLEFRALSLRYARNGRVLATRGFTNRPGTFYERTLDSDVKDIVDFSPSTGDRYALVLTASKLIVLDENAAEVASFSGVPWNASTDIWAVPMGDYVLFGPAGIYVLELSDNAWTFGEYQFRERISGEIAMPFWAFEQGVEIQPSGLTGNVTVTADEAVFTADYVGNTIRYAEQQINVTEFVSSTVIRGDVVSELPPTYKVPVQNISGFRKGEIVVSDQKNWRGQIVEIVPGTGDAGDLHCVTLEIFEGPEAGGEPETVSGTSASSLISAAPTKISPGPTNIWDEQLISSYRGYPRSATNVRGRLVFVDFPQVPNLVAISSAREPNDFDTGSEDDDAIVRKAGDGAPRFLHAVGASDLVLLADQGCYYVKTRDGQLLTPENFLAVQFDERGANEVKPVRVDDGIVFVERAGNTLAAAVLDGNVYLEWSILPLSKYHDHLLSGPTKLCGPAQTTEFTEKYMFVVNADGTIASVSWTSDFGREAIGFIPWTTEGDFLNVSPVLGGYYAMVERTINGSPVRFLERFSDSAMMDCAVESASPLTEQFLTDEDGNQITTEDGDPITAITPATSHLGGKEVGFWWNDYYGGTATLEADGSLADEPEGFTDRQIGLLFTTRMKPWPVELIDSQRAGLLRARVMRLGVSVYETVSFKVRRNGITTKIGSYDFGDALDEPPSRKTKVHRFPVLGNRDHPDMEILRDEPGPFTVLALTQEVQA